MSLSAIFELLRGLTLKGFANDVRCNSIAHLVAYEQSLKMGVVDLRSLFAGYCSLVRLNRHLEQFATLDEMAEVLTALRVVSDLYDKHRGI